MWPRDAGFEDREIPLDGREIHPGYDKRVVSMDSLHKGT